MSPNNKVYHGVLEEIRKFIEANDLRPGDKLPSERELSEKLQAGRSSIREALRAMELIGVIETRRGEGTFLSKYRPYQTVQLLSSFILKETTKEDLLSVKMLLEKETAKLAFTQINEPELIELESILNNSSLNEKEKHFAFFSYLFDINSNQLLMRIWGLIDEYSKSFTGNYSKTFYLKLMESYKTKNYQSIEGLFHEENAYDIV
ncbi:FadR/GntR family transcriptional regulator [Ornithinibacillus sp. 179-J 7C1 HS]|uniref:FadR/GntR family transcriptional regulator n=1 Tax=Ornithinibacillus sp. 179-J 7C1 HS TaxID=3142384 RepID=UPI0039A164C6